MKFFLTEKFSRQWVKKSSVMGQREDTEVGKHLTPVQTKFSLAQLLPQGPQDRRSPARLCPLHTLSCWGQPRSVCPGSDPKCSSSQGLRGDFKRFGPSESISSAHGEDTLQTWSPPNLYPQGAVAPSIKWPQNTDSARCVFEPVKLDKTYRPHVLPDPNNIYV